MCFQFVFFKAITKIKLLKKMEDKRASIYLTISISAIFYFGSLFLFEDIGDFIRWVDFILAHLLIPLTACFLFVGWPRLHDIQHERRQPKHTSS
jgi:hypothetical protein